LAAQLGVMFLSGVVLLRTSIPSLELSELESKDAATLHALVQDNRAHLTRLGDYTDLVDFSTEQLRDQLSADEPRQFGILHAGTLIGTVTLIKYQPTIYGLGYWIASSQSGRGYMTEAVRAVIDFAASECGAEEIWAGITPTNEPSIKLVRRLGFELARTQETHLSFCLRVRSRGGT